MRSSRGERWCIDQRGWRCWPLALATIVGGAHSFRSWRVSVLRGRLAADAYQSFRLSPALTGGAFLLPNGGAGRSRLDCKTFMAPPWPRPHPAELFFFRNAPYAGPGTSSLTWDPSWNLVDREYDRAVAAAGLVSVGAEPALKAGAAEGTAARQGEGHHEDSGPHVTCSNIVFFGLSRW